jgi:hypothetical protein
VTITPITLPSPARFEDPMRRLTLLPVLALAVSIAACSGPGASPAATATSTAAATGIASGAAPSTATGIVKVNANTATQAELQAAFEAAGISNAAKWAKEVAEYRPYAADPTWATLRRELGKYNIDPTVLEQILALLQV